ncbi:hypothetical protein [Streptomyces griseosporeus]
MSLSVITGEVTVTEYGTTAGDETARGHVSVAGLRARGWTPGMVRRLLGEPDLLRPNPVSSAAPRTRLYRLERVEAVERGEEFRAVSAAAARRSATAKAAAYRRRREVLIRIVAEPIEVPRLTPDRLTALAVEHRKRTLEEERRERPDQTAEPAGVEDLDRRTLDRWKVAYLRHQLTRYDELLDGLDGGTGRAGAEALLRRRVYEAIRKTYPDLAEECARQVSEPA